MRNDYIIDKGEVRVEVGDTKQTEFYPQVKVMRWDNEVNFSVRYGDKIPQHNQAGGSIEAVRGNEKTRFYEIQPDELHPEGGYEFEIELAQEPSSNVFEFSLVDKWVDYYYQPALTPEEIAEGAERPEHIIGSYAVYAKELRNHRKGDKNYRAGKVGHIYRPKAIDANNNEVWAELAIENGTLSVTVPQDFLDKATYPVVVDPTLGYTSVGGSTFNTGYQLAPMGSSVEATEDGSITKFVAYLNIAHATNRELKFGLYSITDSFAFVDESDIRVVSSANSDQWNDINVTGGIPLEQGAEYILAGWAEIAVANNNTGYYYDIQADKGYRHDPNVSYVNESGVWPDPFDRRNVAQDRLFSLYVEYETASATEETLSTDLWQPETVGFVTETETHSTDTLTKESLEATHSTDTLVVAPDTSSHSTDSLVIAQQQTTQQTDTFIQDEASHSHDTDTLLIASQASVHSADTLVSQSLDSEHQTDTNIVESASLEHSSDTQIIDSQTTVHSTDTYVSDGLISSHNTDTLLVATQDSSQTTDTLVGERLTETHATDTYVKQSEDSDHTTDSNVYEVASKFHQTDIFVYAKEQAQQLTDSLVIEQQTTSQSLDTFVQDGTSVSFNTDTLVIAEASQSQQVDTLISESSTLTHSTDTVIEELTQDIASHSTDTLIEQLVKETISQHTDTNIIASLGQAHTTSTFIEELTTNSASHSSDTLISEQDQQAHSTSTFIASGLHTAHSSDTLVQGSLSTQHSTTTAVFDTLVEPLTTEIIIRQSDTNITIVEQSDEVV